MQGTLLSVKVGIETFSVAQIGAVGASFWAGIVFGSLRFGKVIQSVGHIGAFVVLGAIASSAPHVEFHGVMQTLDPGSRQKRARPARVSPSAVPPNQILSLRAFNLGLVRLNKEMPEGLISPGTRFLVESPTIVVICL
ncbi:MAG TPA: hypothetical protein VFO40_14020 [Chthoniobacterales bacterium]|nr:hypothetical protein [Chthoniobacterales bacterium]